MKIIYTNNKNNSRLYSIFLDVFNLDYKQYEIDHIDSFIIMDIIKLIDRVRTPICRKTLGRIGIKGYSDLNSKQVKDLLKEHLPKQDAEVIIRFYKENQVILDMFKYEVCEVLNISKWKFDRIKDSLKVSGTQVVNIGCKPKRCNKYDRRFIYEYKLEKR